MIDFHSHILPGIDDGSPDVSTSILLLRSLKRQGVDTVAATSHFYIDRRSPRRFLQRRQEAWEKLKASLPEDAPRVLLGAEVLYFPGISRSDDIPSLCLEGTDLLLLEMPFSHWSERMIREVNELARCGRYTVMLAHIERYYSRYRRAVWDEFLDNGILMQSNADFFLGRFSKHKAMKLLREDRIHVLGTDCHNLESRAPRMKEAISVIRNELGTRRAREIETIGRQVLGEAAQ